MEVRLSIGYSHRAEKSEMACVSLRQDLQYLLQSGHALEQQYEREIGILMSTATIAELRNAQKLTARSYPDVRDVILDNIYGWHEFWSLQAHLDWNMGVTGSKTTSIRRFAGVDHM